MRLLKVGLRLWITLTSVASFMGGWAILAHSPKPVQPGKPIAFQPLEPLNQFRIRGDDDDGFGFQSSGPQIIDRPSLMPSFRTGGS